MSFDPSQLESGRLRDELAGPQAPAAQVDDEEVAPAGAGEQTLPFRFSGDGAEYFRIWVVNMLLTLLTLGVYSAWAKVRKVRYFWHNTRLDGHAFDYHGSALAILRGRVLAVVLLALYTYGFQIAVTLGWLTIGVLLLLGPWLFLSAQRFKLRNSSHRGLRFDFDGSTAAAYRTVLPVLLVWFSSLFASQFLPEQTWAQGLVALATVFAVPWMHHALKRFQHAHARYGSWTFAFTPALVSLYGVYALGLFFVFVGGTVAFFVGRTVEGVVRASALADLDGLLVTAAVALVMYLAVGPFLAVRTQRVVWHHTRLGPMRFRTEISTVGMLRVLLPCIAWTVLTLGLYWPYAAIRLARYRIECMSLIAPAGLGSIAATLTAHPGSAGGEGAADLFGLEIGL